MSGNPWRQYRGAPPTWRAYLIGMVVIVVVIVALNFLLGQIR